MIEGSAKYGIIILNYNNANDCIKLAESLISRLPANYYCIIIDNNSDDIQILKNYCQNNPQIATEEQELPDTIISSPVTLVSLKKNYGYAYGNNVGLRIIHNNKFKYAFVVNPDVEIPQISTLPALINFLNDNLTVGIASPKILLPGGNVQNHFKRVDSSTIIINFLFPFSEALILILKKIQRMVKGYNYIYSGVGCFYAMNLSIMKEIDFFDENTFLYNEEQIIGEKLKEAGYKFAYLPSVSILHNHNYSSQPIHNKYYQESFNYYIDTYIRPTGFIKRLIFISIKYRRLINHLLKR